MPDRLLDWFHVLRAMHIREEQKKNGDFESQRPEEAIPHLKLREAKMPFPSGVQPDNELRSGHFIFPL